MLLAPVTARVLIALATAAPPVAARTPTATAPAAIAGVRVAVVHLSAQGVPPLTAVVQGTTIVFQNDDRIARSVVSTTPNWSLTGGAIVPGGSFVLRIPLTQPGEYRFTSPDGLAVASSASGIITVAGAAGATAPRSSGAPPGSPQAGGAARLGGAAVRGGHLPEASTGRAFGLPAVLAVALIIGVLSLLGRLALAGRGTARRP